MTKGEDCNRKGKCKTNHCSSMSNSAWCDLNSKSKILKLHDKCPNPKCNCRKVITSKPHQYTLEGGSIKSKIQKTFRGTQTARNKLLKPAINATAPFIALVVSAKTKKPKVGQATTNILKSISGVRILSLTDMHGNGFRLKVL